MKNIKKSLSVLLTLVMLFTTLCFFNPGFGVIEADAAISGIKIVVPETIYLKPSTGASTAGQYYINNNSDGSVKAAYDTAASVSVTYPGATLKSVSATNANIGAITGLNGTALSSSAATASGAVTLNSGINAGSTTLIEWVFVFEKDGKTQTHYAYSVAYAPYLLPVGAATRAKSGTQSTFASSVLWVSGIHGYVSGTGNNLYYIQTSKFFPILGINTAPGNNNPDTNWIQSGSNGYSATFSYTSKEGGAFQYHALSNSISPTAVLTVDTSRYNNFNQIPNFNVGFIVTDKEDSKEGKWLVADYTGKTSGYNNSGVASGSSYESDYNYATGTKIAYNDNDNNTGIKYDGTWNMSITSSADYRIKSAVWSYRKSGAIKSSCVNGNFVDIKVTGANKSALRTAVLNGTSYAKENYTTASWNTYYNALKAAATNLGNPTSATVDTSALTNAETALQTNVYLNANGGSISTGSFAVTIGGNNTASANVSSYVPTREGYVFKGWATSPNATSGSTSSVNVGFNQTLYAVWQPYVIFDNLIDFRLWNKTTAINATISDVTDNGFTLTSNDGVGEGTSTSPFFPVTPGKQYKVEMDFEGDNWDVYIFFCDTNGSWIDFADGPSNRYSSNGSTGVDPDNAVFTSPNKAEVVKAQIRVDANGSGNSVRFSNIRVYEVGKVTDNVPYILSETYAYGSVYGSELPSPSMYGYAFTGWVDENGNPVASDARVDFTTTKYLYSTWTPGTYTMTFNTDGGSAVSSITGQYDTSYAKPNDPTKTGYTFAGWSPALPDKIPGADNTYTALWNANKYNVSFNANGGSGAMQNITAVYDTASVVPANTFTKEGYTFTGWSLTPDGAVICADKGEILNLTAAANGSVTLYAVWTINQYTITYDAANGTQNIVQTYDFNAPVTAPADPTKEGYTFKGWSGLPAAMPSGNITVTAIWDINRYTITYDALNGKENIVHSYDYNAKVNAPADPTREGYTFKGWANLPENMPAGNITVTAVWEINQYTITFDTQGGTAIAPITQDFNTDVTAPADPTKEGYTFAGWDSVIPSTMPAGNMTITAKWNINTYTITFDTDGGTLVDPITQEYDTAVTVPAAPTKEGYTFAGWDTEIPANMPAKNMVIKARWTVNNYTVDYAANGGQGSVASQSFKYTDSVVLRENAFTKTGYHFVGWALTADGEAIYQGGQSGLPALTAKADEVVTLYAVWEKNSYTVTFDKNDTAATGTMAVQGFIYDEAEALASLGFSKEGYHFVEWNTSSDGSGTAYTDMAEVINLTAENNGNVTLYAIWTINLYDVTFKFFDADGDEITVTRTDVPHGTDFAGLVPTASEGFSSYYYIPGSHKSAPHYVFSGTWENQVEKITADTEFTAVYSEEAHTLSIIIGENKAASCTEEGLDAVYCTVCDFEYREVIPMKEHGWYETGRTATCTQAGYINFKCSVCGGTKQEVLPALGHTAEGGRWEITTPVTCITDGEESHYCGRCNEIYETKAITASGHTFTEIEYEAPDCTNEGIEAHLYCAVCELYFPADADIFSAEGKETDEEFIIPANGHKTVLVDAVAPKCEEDGNVAYYTCENCDLLFADEAATVIITQADTVDPKTGHNYEATVTPPTCTEKGYTTYVCKNDSTHTYKDNYEDSLGHTEGETVIENDNPASCTENGSYDEVVYCTVCKVQLSRVTKVHKATGHTEAKKQEVITQATCTTAGDYWDITYCSVCDTELARVKVTGKTLPHTYTEEIIDEAHLKTEALCNAYAVYYYDCIYCTANAKDAADKDNYTFEYVAGGFDADNHTGATTTRDEDIVPGTCNKEKTWNEVTRCDDCNAIITSVPKTGEKDNDNHVGATEIRKENVVAGTCTSVETWNDVTYCLDCNNAIKTEAKTGSKNPANHSTTQRVLKDQKEATCCEEGFTGNLCCKDCDEIVTPGETIPTTKDNHAGGTRVEKEDIVPGTCMTPETWNNVTYCVGCGDKLSSVPATGEINPQNHTGNNTVTRTNETPATCETPNTWTEITVCECGVTVKTENKTGEKNPDAHTGETYIEKTDVNAGDCMHKETWTEITYCKGCDKELGRAVKEGEKDPEIHTGVTEIKAENIVAGTCISERSWDEVTYCECGAKLNTVHKTGEKDAENHAGTPTMLVGYKAPTCKLEGYTGDKHYTCCNELYEVGTAIPTVPHTPGEAVTENNVPPTENEDGHYDSVIYCTVCHEEISRETIIVRPEREITFVLYDKTVIVKAYLGDTVTAPEVGSYTSIDGFIHSFKSWDKPLTVVTGPATYTAVYTQPCDYTELDTLYDTLNEVLEGDFVEDSVLEENKAQIEKVLKAIEEINKDRNTRDSSQQANVDVVSDSIRGIIDIIYPDAGSTLVITGSAVQYTGGALDIKAVKMPVGTTVTDVIWTSSDEDIVFISGGKLFAVGTGTVTITATRGILKAVKTISIVTGGDIRGINFTSVDNTKFIIEDSYKVKNSAIIYWTDAQPLRFTLTNTSQSILYERYAVYLNGFEIRPNTEGYYVIPAGSGDAQITVAIIMKDDGEGTGGEITTKWSFWEWILSFFRRIADFFKNIGK